jgi:transposase
MWMVKGEQVKIPAPGTNQKVHVFGAWNYAKDRIHYQTHQKKTRHEFLTFLKHLIERRYPRRYVVLVCDNASYHHARIIQEYLETVQNRVFVFWLPAYAPELNLIERVWKHLKQVGLNNFYFETLEKLEQAIHQVFDAVNLKKMTLQITFEKHNELCTAT